MRLAGLLMAGVLLWAVPGIGAAQQAVVPALDAEALAWLASALNDHGFPVEEAAVAADCDVAAVRKAQEAGTIPSTAQWAETGGAKVLPYPGGRHPRIGFLEGAIDPMRGTKVSIFAPWAAQSFAVVDVPEAIFSNLGLIFLAHTHIPTLWDEQGQKLENIDWTRNPDGSLTHERTLPNGIVYGSRVMPAEGGAKMRLWLRNGTDQLLTGLRTQVCVMLKGLEGFDAQTRDNKTLDSPVALAKGSGDAPRYVLTAWEHAGRVWENPPLPCIHSDPVFPNCGPGETVEVKGEIVFYEGDGLAGEVERLKAAYASPQ